MIYQNHIIFLNSSKRWEKMPGQKLNLLIKLFICFKFFPWKIVYPLLNDLFDNNIAILESKIIYFCVRPNFYECTTLRNKYLIANF